MIKNPPLDQMLTRNHVSIAWPVDLLKEIGSNTVVGFIMPRVENAKTLINVFNLQKRLQEAPAIDWSHLHVIAENVAIIVEAIHASGYIIGDLKPQNLLIPEDTLLVSIVDTDSFQISDVKTNNIYRCSVGTAEYTPPELYGKNLKEVIRTEANDLFGLGVIIYLLLFGEHPFSGIICESQQSGSLRGVDQRIAKGSWPYAPNSPIRRREYSIPLEIVHPKIQQYLYSCFTLGHDNPWSRPKASEWKEALSTGRKNLVSCARVSTHKFNQSFGKCFWCEMKLLKHLDFYPDTFDAKQAVISRPSSVTPARSPASSGPPVNISSVRIQKQASYSGENIWVVLAITFFVFIVAVAIISIF
jgi:DNA-binding helix-hairpin-helix protein with protein kinase domain